MRGHASVETLFRQIQGFFLSTFRLKPFNVDIWLRGSNFILRQKQPTVALDMAVEGRCGDAPGLLLAPVGCQLSSSREPLSSFPLPGALDGCP